MRVTQPDAHHLAVMAALPCVPGTGLTPDAVMAELDAGRLRPEWSSVALDDSGRVIGRAMWWGRDSSAPIALDLWDVHPDAADPHGVLARLLEHGHARLAETGLAIPLPHTMRVPVTWREDPAVVADVEVKALVAGVGGLTASNERLQFQWDEGAPLPPPPRRLTFETVDDATMIDLIARAAAGSSDVMTQRQLRRVTARELACDELDYYASCPGERSWWRAVRAPEGCLVGLAIPSATPTNRNVGYLAVLPEHRGRGYVDDILAFVTQFHAEAGAPRITATTDAVNVSMVAAFERAGYQLVEVRIDLERL